MYERFKEVVIKMAEEYILTRDIIQDHSERMLNIRKYYPYFKLTESTFSQFLGGRYDELDMGYILMAVLRFFIEENNFKEKDVTYDEYSKFMHDIYRRDFALALDEEEEREVTSYIFDKIKNEGRPFSYTYFDPADKKRKTVRMKLIDSRIKEDSICYYITSDAIEFYLDTKEIKDESSISVAQALLSKMITTSNFKGGIEVIKRINSEVSRLKARKNEVLNILSYDVFEGAKAYEEFVDTGMRWFEDEQKLFVKNMELAKEAEKRIDAYKDDKGVGESIAELYYLEAELKKAINKHSELLAACTDLQIKADEIISGAKYSKLRRSFNFKDALRMMMEKNDSKALEMMILPLLDLNIKKQFALTSIDKLLSAKVLSEDKGEAIEKSGEVEYVYEDELEEQRISDNYVSIITVLVKEISNLDFGESFNLRELNIKLAQIFGEGIYKNGDYYSLLVHMSQKKHYDIAEVVSDTDTFFEAELKRASKNILEDVAFMLSFDDDDKVKLAGDIFEISNIKFTRV